MRLLGSRKGFGVLAVLLPALVVAACSDDEGGLDPGDGASGAAGDDGQGGGGGKGGGGAGATSGSPGKGGAGAVGGAAAMAGETGSAGEPGGGGMPGAAGETSGEGGMAGAGGAGPGEVVGDTYVLTDAGRLLVVERASGLVASATQVSGLGAGEHAVGMDFRPSDGLLYALTDAGKLYTVALDSGVATLKTTLKADPNDATSPFTGLTGTSFGVDFNPVANRLRVVSDSGQNLRINVDVVDNTITDGALNPAAPAVAAAAYTNNFAAACRTRLFVIDASSGKLLLQDPPNDGKLVEVGDLGSDDVFDVFEIVSREDASHNLVSDALAVASGDEGAALYDVDLTSGAASNPRLLALEGDEAVIGLSVSPPSTALTQTRGELSGISASNKLVSFNRGAPGKLCSSQAVSGLAGGEQLLGIDSRPADAKLYALSSAGKLYTLAAPLGSPVTAVEVPAVLVATLAADPADASSPFTALAGTNFGLDFNPVPNRLRVVSDSAQNLRINVDIAAGVTTDAALVGATGVSAAAYTNSFVGATTTTLFVLDAATDALARVGASPATGGACPGDVGNPNCGVVTTVGLLGIGDITGVGGFDIDGQTAPASVALAAVSIGAATSSTLISINLETGAAANPPGVANATIGGGELLRGLAFNLSP